MTFHKLLGTMASIEGLRIHFKRIEERLVLIFWRGSYPVAHVYVDADDYNIEYLRLYEMELSDILKIDQALYDFTQIPVEEREIDL